MKKRKQMKINENKIIFMQAIINSNNIYQQTLTNF